MNSSKKKEKLLLSLDYIDPDMISGAVRRIDEKKNCAQITQRKHSMVWKIAPLVAACLVLLCLAIPALIGQPEPPTIVIEHDTHIPQTDLRANNTNINVETEIADIYDGSRGLLYKVNEDGTEATLIGFGDCTDEVVYVATHFNGLPVTKMYYEAYWEADDVSTEEQYYFSNRYLKKLVISDTVKTIDNYFIKLCQNIESVYYGASVERIGFLGFSMGYGENFSTVEVSDANPYYSDIGGCIVDLRTKTLVLATEGAVIPDDGSVEVIGLRAFHNLDMEQIVIPEGVKVIDSGAFMNCLNLKSVVLPTSLEELYPTAFAHCDALEVFDLNGFTYLPEGVLWWSPSLKEIRGSENLVSIGERALSQSGLSKIALGTCLEKIDASAFGFYRYDKSILIDYAGTEAEWNDIEKILDWNYRSDCLTVKCKDATITPEAYMEAGGPRDPEQNTN